MATCLGYVSSLNLPYLVLKKYLTCKFDETYFFFFFDASCIFISGVFSLQSESLFIHSASDIVAIAMHVCCTVSVAYI